MIDEPTFEHDELSPEEIAQREAVKAQADQADNDLLMVMQTKAGRRVMYKIIHTVSGLKDKSFTGNSQTFFNEGQRSVGRRIDEDLLSLDKNLYLLMVQENL